VLSFWEKMCRVLSCSRIIQRLSSKRTLLVGAFWNYASVRTWNTLASQSLFSKRHSPGVLRGGGWHCRRVIITGADLSCADVSQIASLVRNSGKTLSTSRLPSPLFPPKFRLARGTESNSRQSHRNRNRNRKRLEGDERHRSGGSLAAVASSVFVETYQSDRLPHESVFLSHPVYHPLLLLLRDENPVRGWIPDETRIRIPKQAVFFFSLGGIRNNCTRLVS
jgi:hypothetical protein